MENDVVQYFNAFYRSKGIKQKEFCEMVGIAEGTIKNMKSRGTNPSMDTIKKIKSVFPDFDLIPSDTEGNESITRLRELYSQLARENEALKSEVTDLLRENRKLNNEIKEIREEREAPQRRAGTKSA